MIIGTREIFHSKSWGNFHTVSNAVVSSYCCFRTCLYGVGTGSETDCSVAQNPEVTDTSTQQPSPSNGPKRKKRTISPELAELRNMEQQLLAQMNHSIEILSPIPVSLMKVEFAQDNRVEQIIAELTEFNKHMGQLAESYQDLNKPPA